MLLLFLACATAPVPSPVPAAPVPSPAPAAPEAEPEPEPEPEVGALTRPPFDAAALAAGLPVGTHVVLRIEADNAPPMTEEWTFVAADASGCTIRSVTRADDGTVVADETGRSTWSELQSHGMFPAAWTTASEDRVTVPAGTFDTVKYVVRDPDAGDTKVLHFAKRLPGPPVWMEVQAADGTRVLRMTMVVRDVRPAP